MSRERHRRLQEIFLAAVELPIEERESYLGGACGDDPELYREVTELLAADSDDTEGARPSTVGDGPAREFHGTGTYRVISEIGRGGMGVVYLGERADGAFRRRVAIKVLRQGVDRSGELVTRFRGERQILATLDHPNIARLLDAGTLSDGAPFLVMEHIDGEPIDRFAAVHGLTVEERLELFMAVCHGVQAAHQSLVVHRDLKPSNILVTADGVPKLLDFGIAKLLAPEAVDWTTAETRRGSQPLTPRYASPEQIDGGAITTATDVYSLGVVLYELLTGQLPYRPESTAIAHWIEAVCDQDPLPPSAAVRRPDPHTASVDETRDRAELARRLEDDLDHIVLKALRKEPRQRYASAAELAEDLRRHLDGHPIQARRATLTYRTGKFVRRHRLAIAAVAALILVSGGFTVELVRQLRRTEVERDKARTVTELLIQVFEVSGPSVADGHEPTAIEVLEHGLARVEEQVDDQPAVKAALLNVIGRVYNNLGRLEESTGLQEEALELWRGVRDEMPLEYAEGLAHLAHSRMVAAKLVEAEALYREALQILLAEVGEEDRRTISCLDGLHHTLARAGHHHEASAMVERALRLSLLRLGYRDVEAVLASGSADPELVAVATSLGNLATEQRELGRYGEAERSLTQAIALSRRLLGDGHFHVAFHLNNLANIHSNQGRPEVALDERAEALTVAEGVFGPDHPAVASMVVNQAYDLINLGRYEEALKATDRARESLTTSLGADHPAVAMAMSFAGLARLGLGHLDQALALESESLELLGRQLGPGHPEVAKARGALASVLHALGRHEEAVEHAEQAWRSLVEALGGSHPDTLMARCRSADPLLALGRTSTARSVLEEVVTTMEDRGDLPHLLARARFRLARALEREEPGSAEATHLAEEALATFVASGNHRAGMVQSWLAER